MDERRPISEVLAELLTVEARMSGLGARGAELRQSLEARAREQLAVDGVAPTWRAPGLGTASYSNPQPKLRITDSDAFGSWAAQRYPESVAATIHLPAAVLERAMELLTPLHDDGAHIAVDLVVDGKWQTEFVDGCAIAGDPPSTDVFAPISGEHVDGMTLLPAAQGTLSVRLDKEAKARAAAELADPVAAGMMASPLGALALPDEAALRISADLAEEALDDAEGEPEHDDLPPVPLDPEGAARHAIEHQGGFSTPATEAFRILHDSLRIMAFGLELNADWRGGVIATLAWLDDHEHDEPGVAAERAKFVAAARGGGTWEQIRGRLEAAISVSLTAADALVADPPPAKTDAQRYGLIAGETVEQLKLAQLRTIAGSLGLSKAGTRPVLIARIRKHEKVPA